MNLVLAATPLLAALLWVAAIVVDPGPLASGSVLLVGLGLISTAAVAVVGMVMTGGRWARNTSIAVLTASLGVALVRPIDGLWIAALLATAVALGALVSGRLAKAGRRLPAASGPPPIATFLPLALLIFPAWLGLAAGTHAGPATLVVGVTAPVAALWYARVLPGGLIGVRVLWPALAIGLAPLQDLAPGILSAAAALLVAALAWQAQVKQAFHPPREVGTSFPIPPELAPREVLETARLDEQGKPGN